VAWASLVVSIVVLSVALGSSAADAATASSSGAAAPAGALRAPSEFAHITDPMLRSIALFEEAGKVIQHPRCLNCHPSTEQPTQTDEMRPHRPLVLRGATGSGMPGMPCAACHHDTNFDPAHVPGHANWHLAPRSMTWAGRSLAEICVQIKDPARNGGRDLAALVRHMAEDSLVGWAWSPGASRTPAPGSQREFGALLRAWVESGAVCPAPP
jgi:hypothetical protein